MPCGWPISIRSTFQILPGRNSTKAVYCYLFVHPDWFDGSPASIDGEELGGHADALPEENAAWYEERSKGLRLLEVRGRIRITDAPPLANETDANGPADDPGDDGDGAETDEDGDGPSDRKDYGLPRYIALGDGQLIDTQKSTIPGDSLFTCSLRPQQDLRLAIQKARGTAPVFPYAIQGYCSDCATRGTSTAADSSLLHRGPTSVASIWPRPSGCLDAMATSRDTGHAR